MTDGWGTGAATFADELAEFAASTSHVAVARLAAGLRRPLGVAVVGRRGVGRTTVEQALRRHGVRVTATAGADLRVLVIAETLKPEEHAQLIEPTPTLVVLNKADLLRRGPRDQPMRPERVGPLAAARAWAQGIEAASGVPVEVLVGLLAAVDGLDAQSWVALRTLVDEPADLASVDAFVTTGHPVPGDTRGRLLDRLDRFGIAHAVLALSDGTPPPGVLARLHELSNVEAVLHALRGLGAAVHHRRLHRALTELRCELVRSGDVELTRFAGSYAATMAVMTAAVEVVEADGLRVDRADDPDGHARRATRWAAYGRGPVGALHRACAADIVRGSLRLLARGTP